MALAPSFVTWDMIPAPWMLSPEQEKEWLREVAVYSPGETAETLERHVCIELPDLPLAWAYQEAYITAAASRNDLVPPMISARDQWASRTAQMREVIWCLVHGRPPLVAICAIAGRRPGLVP